MYTRERDEVKREHFLRSWYTDYNSLGKFVVQVRLKPYVDIR